MEVNKKRAKSINEAYSVLCSIPYGDGFGAKKRPAGLGIVFPEKHMAKELAEEITEATGYETACMPNGRHFECIIVIEA